jgi:hypothetical protein
VEALKKVPFHLNSNDFHFDTEIIIQFLNAALRIEELPIPTYYGDEISRVNGMKYAKDVIVATTRNSLHRAGILHQRRFDTAPHVAPTNRRSTIRAVITTRSPRCRQGLACSRLGPITAASRTSSQKKDAPWNWWSRRPDASTPTAWRCAGNRWTNPPHSKWKPVTSFSSTCSST